MGQIAIALEWWLVAMFCGLAGLYGFYRYDSGSFYLLSLAVAAVLGWMGAVALG